MPLIRQGRPTIWHFAPSPTLGPVPIAAPAPAFVVSPNNDLLQDFIWTFRERAQALAAPTALAAKT